MRAEGLALWVAQGFGVGRIPVAPGTFGSVVGLLWVFLLLRLQNFWLYLIGLTLGVILSVWLCGIAETILKQTDPSSVVLDEIVAMPLCFLAWVAQAWFRIGRLPEPESLFQNPSWWRTVLIFALFRFFDVVKPWPVHQSQRLPGGWGVTVDDLLASLYVAGITLLFIR